MAIGVPRPLAIEKPQAVDLVQAARYFGAHGEPDAATLALLQKCAVPLLAVAMPRAVWLLADTPALTEAGLLPWAAHWPSRPPMPPRRSCVSGRRPRESI